MSRDCTRLAPCKRIAELEAALARVNELHARWAEADGDGHPRAPRCLRRAELAEALSGAGEGE